MNFEVLSLNRMGFFDCEVIFFCYINLLLMVFYLEIFIFMLFILMFYIIFVGFKVFNVFYICKVWLLLNLKFFCSIID